MTSRDSALRYLLATQDSKGGWGFRAGGQAFTEATALGLLGLAAEPTGRAAAIRWLLEGQHADGGWGVSRADPESGWTTAWAVWALAAAGVRDGVGRGIDWLLGHRSVPVKVPAAISRLDGTLVGWSWTPATFGWIEPTALAMLAIHASGSADRGAFAAGRAMLLDRACTGGGWNYGNTTMIDNEVPASIPETALVLLALRAGQAITATPAPVDAAGPDPHIPAGLAYLRRSLDPVPGALSLAWSVLALSAWGADASEAAALLRSAQGGAGDWSGNPATTALGALAMEAAGL